MTADKPLATAAGLPGTDVPFHNGTPGLASVRTTFGFQPDASTSGLDGRLGLPRKKQV